MAARRAAVLGLVPSLLLAGCGAGGDRTGLVVFPDMYASVPYDAYDESAAAPGGQALLLPPEGTVPVGHAPFAYGATKEEAERAGRELANPLPATPENLARGKERFTQICQVCHGPKGEGDGPIIGRFPNPASLLSDRAKGLPDGQIFHIITRGQGIMPPHGIQVRPEDRWRIVHHVRTLQRARAPAVGAAPMGGAAPAGAPAAPPPAGSAGHAVVAGDAASANPLEGARP